MFSKPFSIALCALIVLRLKNLQFEKQRSPILKQTCATFDANILIHTHIQTVAFVRNGMAKDNISIDELPQFFYGNHMLLHAIET
jgi:hypothetical protein